MGLLRLLLAYSVVYMHYGRLPGSGLLYGSAVVLGFFIISGFYMSLVLTETYCGSDRIRLFYTNRFLRVLPAYFVVLCIAATSIFVLRANPYMSLHEYSSTFASYSFLQKLFIILPNIAIFGQDLQFLFYFDGQTAKVAQGTTESFKYPFNYLFVPQAWSIAIELGFYVLAPFLVRWSSRNLVAITLASLGMRCVLAYYGLPNDPWLYRFFPTSICFFILGMLSYRIYRAKADFWSTPAIGWTCTLIIIMIPLFQNLWSPVVSGIAPELFPDGHLFLWLAPLLLPGVFALTKNWTLDRAIGELSYPLYLVHYIVYEYMYRFFVGSGQFGYFKSTAAIVTYDCAALVAAFVLYKFVDQPIDNWRHRKFAAAGILSRSPEPQPPMVETERILPSSVSSSPTISAARS